MYITRRCDYARLRTTTGHRSPKPDNANHTTETGDPDRPTRKNPSASLCTRSSSSSSATWGAPTHSCAHPFSCCSAFDFVRSLNAFTPRGRSSLGDSGGVASQPNAWPVFVNAVVAAVGGGVEAADAALAALLLKGARCCVCGKERFSMSDSAERVASAD